MKEMLFNFVAYYQQVKSILLNSKNSSNNRQRELSMIPSYHKNSSQQTQPNIITQNQQFMQTSTNFKSNNFSMANFKSVSLTVSKVFAIMLVMLTFMFTTIESFGQACVPPSAQPTALVVNPTTGTVNSITGSFTASVPASTQYLVVRTLTNVAPVPVNGTAYTVSSTAMGTGTFVVSNSAATTFTSTGLTAGTTYYYWVFSSSGNCTGESYNYLSLASEVNAAAPLTGSATTNSPVAPTCASVSPASGTINVSPFATV